MNFVYLGLVCYFFGSSAQRLGRFNWINSFALVVEINKPHKDTTVS